METKTDNLELLPKYAEYCAKNDITDIGLVRYLDEGGFDMMFPRADLISYDIMDDEIIFLILDRVTRDIIQKDRSVERIISQGRVEWFTPADEKHFEEWKKENAK